VPLRERTVPADIFVDIYVRELEHRMSLPGMDVWLSDVFMLACRHLTIAPGASHSGYEDNFQADQYHYVHHAKFECNYGSPTSAFIDQYFGTFRERVGKSVAYKVSVKLHIL